MKKVKRRRRKEVKNGKEVKVEITTQARQREG